MFRRLTLNDVPSPGDGANDTVTDSGQARQIGFPVREGNGADESRGTEDEAPWWIDGQGCLCPLAIKVWSPPGGGGRCVSDAVGRGRRGTRWWW